MKVTKKADVIIIGAGLQGCSTALQLALKKKKVIIIDRNSAGRHASGVNAGGVRRLYRAIEEIPLSVAAQDMWHHIDQLVDSDCEFQACGQVKLAENEEEMKILEKRAKLIRSLGYNHEKLIDESEVRQIVPAAQKSCMGGLASFEDGSAQPYLTTRAFRNKGLELGVAFFENHRITAIGYAGNTMEVEAEGKLFQAPILVNCAGAWGGDIAEQLGDSVPITAVALCMMVTAAMPHFLDPVVSLTQRKLSFKQMKNGTVVIGGGHVGSINADKTAANVNFKGLKISADTVSDVFPIMKDSQIVRTWAGIEGIMPDMIPVISKSANTPNVFHAFGFSAHGFQLSPIIGVIMAELILEGKSKYPIDPFRIDRFTDTDSSQSELAALISDSIT